MGEERKDELLFPLLPSQERDLFCRRKSMNMQMQGRRNYKKEFCMRIRGGRWDLGLPAERVGQSGGHPISQVLSNLPSPGKSSIKSVYLPWVSRASRGFRKKKTDVKFCFPVRRETGKDKPKLWLGYFWFRSYDALGSQ